MTLYVFIKTCSYTYTTICTATVVNFCNEQREIFCCFSNLDGVTMQLFRFRFPLSTRQIAQLFQLMQVQPNLFGDPRALGPLKKEMDKAQRYKSLEV